MIPAILSMIPADLANDPVYLANDPGIFVCSFFEWFLKGTVSQNVCQHSC